MSSNESPSLVNDLAASFLSKSLKDPHLIDTHIHAYRICGSGIRVVKRTVGGHERILQIVPGRSCSIDRDTIEAKLPKFTHPAKNLSDANFGSFKRVAFMLMAQESKSPIIEIGLVVFCEPEDVNCYLTKKQFTTLYPESWQIVETFLAQQGIDDRTDYDLYKKVRENFIDGSSQPKRTTKLSQDAPAEAPLGPRISIRSGDGDGLITVDRRRRGRTSGQQEAKSSPIVVGKRPREEDEEDEEDTMARKKSRPLALSTKQMDLRALKKRETKTRSHGRIAHEQDGLEQSRPEDVFTFPSGEEPAIGGQGPPVTDHDVDFATTPPRSPESFARTRSSNHSGSWAE